MKKTTSWNISLAAAFLLIGTLAIAQTPSQKIKNGTAAKGIGSAGVPARNTQGSDLQRKDGAIHSADYGRVSGARVKSHSNSANNRQQNDSAANQNNGKASTNSVAYKDPEDMTTRSSAGATHGVDGGANAAAHAASKHAAGVKYQDFTPAPSGQQTNPSSSNKEEFKQDFGQVQANKR